jgi:transcriptional regulator with PAS, ATPase and Fis domain
MKEHWRKWDERQNLRAAAFESSHDGIAVYGPEGVLLDCNRAWERAWEQISGLRGYSDWIGKSRLERQRQLGYNGPEIMNKVTAGAGPAEMILVNNNGDTLLTTATPILDSKGNIKYVVMNVRNLTYLNHLKQRLDQNTCVFTEVEHLRTERVMALLAAANLKEIKVASPGMYGVLLLVGQLAALDTTVLICGETGTGKGVVARMIHSLSSRASKPFVEVNCGAIPESLVESELFGYEPGAFTGSHRSGKKGQIELAHGGTLFLDEISELPLSSQVKLLKFLDDKVVSPLGSANQAGRRSHPGCNQWRPASSGQSGQVPRRPSLSARSDSSFDSATA